ncbi:MAG: hypothetical protein U9Q96_02380 [Patescibacteria group bacterium]|nr:hypothetical protein [Patescibacteria group bacterium]
MDNNKEADVRFWDSTRDSFVSEWYLAGETIRVAALDKHELLLRPEDALRNHLPDIIMGLLTEVRSLRKLTEHLNEGGRKF